MDQELVLEGKKYISSRRLATETGYASDYISRLCRDSKIDGKLVGRNWYVNLESLMNHQGEMYQKKKEYPQLKRTSARMEKIEPKEELPVAKKVSKESLEFVLKESILSRISDTTDISTNLNDIWDNYLMSDGEQPIEEIKKEMTSLPISEPKLNITIEKIATKNAPIITEKPLVPAQSTPLNKIPKNNRIKTAPLKMVDPVEFHEPSFSYRNIVFTAFFIVILFLGSFFARQEIYKAFVSMTEESFTVNNSAHIEGVTPIN